MDYRQYHNLTETYLSQVNEDTKQEQLDESILGALAAASNLGSRAVPILNRVAQGLLGLEGLAIASSIVDEFEGEKKPGEPGYGVFDPKGDMDKDGRLNDVDLDIDGDGILNDYDDNPYGGYGADQAGKRIFRISRGPERDDVEIENPFDEILRKSDEYFLQYPTEKLEDLYNYIADMFEETEKKIGRPLLNEEKQQILESEQLNEVAGLLLRLAGPALKLGGKALNFGWKQIRPLITKPYRSTAYGTGLAVGLGGADYLDTRDAQAEKDRVIDQVDEINAEYFDDNRTMQEQEILDAIFSFIEFIRNSGFGAMLDSAILEVVTEDELYEWLTNNVISVPDLYAQLAQLAAEIEYRQNNPIDPQKAAASAADIIRAEFSGMTDEEILAMLRARQAEGAETLGDILNPG